MYLSFNSDVLTSSQITDYLTRVVQPQLQTINGVANAQILGGQTFAMRIWLNPEKMAALGVTPTEVRTALAANNFTSGRRPDQGRLRADDDQRPDLARQRFRVRPAHRLGARRRARAPRPTSPTSTLGAENADFLLGVQRTEGRIRRHLSPRRPPTR